MRGLGRRRVSDGPRGGGQRGRGSWFEVRGSKIQNALFCLGQPASVLLANLRKTYKLL